MCEVSTLLAISSAASVAGTLHSAHEQGKAYTANAEAANQAKMQEDQQMAEVFAQKQQDAAQEKISINRRTMETAARARVAMGESGASDNTGGVIGDIMRQGLEANQGVTQNLARDTRQLHWDQVGSASRAQSRINSVARPSVAGTLLQAGAQAASGAANYKYAKANQGTPKKKIT